jgi:hypothetical protein
MSVQSLTVTVRAHKQKQKRNRSRNEMITLTLRRSHVFWPLFKVTATDYYETDLSLLVLVYHSVRFFPIVLINVHRISRRAKRAHLKAGRCE